MIESSRLPCEKLLTMNWCCLCSGFGREGCLRVAPESVALRRLDSRVQEFSYVLLLADLTALKIFAAREHLIKASLGYLFQILQGRINTYQWCCCLYIVEKANGTDWRKLDWFIPCAMRGTMWKHNVHVHFCRNVCSRKHDGAVTLSFFAQCLSFWRRANECSDSGFRSPVSTSLPILHELTTQVPVMLHSFTMFHAYRSSSSSVS